MVRLPRNLSRVAIACSVALSLGSVLPVWAQDAAQPAAPNAQPIGSRTATAGSPVCAASSFRHPFVGLLGRPVHCASQCGTSIGAQ